MPAFTGEPWRALAKVRVTQSTTSVSGRTCVVALHAVPTPDTETGDQTDWLLTAGTTYTLHFGYQRVGTPPFALPNLVEVYLRLPNGAQFGTTIWNPVAVDNSSSDSRSFKISADPLEVAAAARAGTLELYVRMAKTDGVVSDRWDADSRGVGTPPVGHHIVFARGYVRAAARQATALPSWELQTAFGATPAVFAFGDDLVGTVRLREPLVQAASLTASIRDGGSVVRTASVSGTGASDYVYSWAGAGAGGRVNNGFDADADDVHLAWPTTVFPETTDLLTVWDSATRDGFVTTAAEGEIKKVGAVNVDPRLTHSHIMQVNSSTFASPPGSSAAIRANGQRLTADLAFIASRVVNARGEGINGLTWAEKLWDSGNLTGTEGAPTKQRAAISSTIGGQTGWSDAFLTWDNMLPSGSWTHKAAITTSDATGLSIGESRTLTLVAVDPSIKLAVEIVQADETLAGRHLTAGSTVGVRLMALNASDQKLLALDSSPAPSISLFRFVGTELQYLNASLAWQAMSPGAAASKHVLTQEGTTGVWSVQFLSDAAWGTRDVFAIGYASFGGTPYTDRARREFLGSYNPHGP